MIPYANMTTEQLLATTIAAEGRTDDELVEEARALVADQALAIIKGFPADPDRLVEMLSALGKPFPNYSTLGSMHGDEPHPVLNRVKYRAPEDRKTTSVHYVAGPLAPHSARAWTDPRPAYFAMYMVDSGWSHLPDDRRGMSAMVKWHDLFQNMHHVDGENFDEHVQVIRERPFEFTTKNVAEPTSNLPLVYALDDARDEFDLGVRMKQDMMSVVRAALTDSADDQRYAAAVQALVEAAADPANQLRFDLQSGDVIILDNNRVSHARAGFEGEATVDGVRQLNPREIWSTTLA